MKLKSFTELKLLMMRPWTWESNPRKKYLYNTDFKIDLNNLVYDLFHVFFREYIKYYSSAFTMDLFNMPTVPNELTPEVLAKVNFYREDVTCAKLRPEYLLMEKFCVDNQWKKEVTPHVFAANTNETIADAAVENDDKFVQADEEAEKKRQLDQCDKDENGSEIKKAKSDMITKVSLKTWGLCIV